MPHQLRIAYRETLDCMLNLRIVHAKAHGLYREMIDLFPANERAPEVERALGELDACLSALETEIQTLS